MLIKSFQQCFYNVFILAIRYIEFRIIITNSKVDQSTLERSFIGGNTHQDERKYLTQKRKRKQD